MFAQQNCLTSLAPLACLPHLDTLNVSSNRLASLEGVAALRALTSLQARPRTGRVHARATHSLNDALPRHNARWLATC